MAKLTKVERVKQYNQANPDYHITGIKKIEKDFLQWQRENASKSLDEEYKSYSNAKRDSYRAILNTYEPKEIICVQGNSMTYSVKLIASNGDTLWITRCNNYLIEEV